MITEPHATLVPGARRDATTRRHTVLHGGVLVRLAGVAMRVLGVLLCAFRVPLRLLGVAVGMMMGGFVVVVGRGGVMRRREHVMLVGGVLLGRHF
jgi:hypothetical protein